jgi:hypothetical protein
VIKLKDKNFKYVFIGEVMAKLLTLALAETRDEADENGYEVISWDIDENKWVLIRKLPMDKFMKNGEVAWDIFAITEAKLTTDYNDQRKEVLNIDFSAEPRIIERIEGNDEKIQLLERLKVYNIREGIYNRGLNVGLISPQEVSQIYFFKRESYGRGYLSNEKLFNWQSRIEFDDDIQHWSWSSGGAPCKDMRWKKYWHELILTRESEYFEKENKWTEYLNSSKTYFVIEIYPPMTSGNVRGCFGDYSRKYFSVAGIHSIK